MGEKPRSCDGCGWLYFEEPSACDECFDVGTQGENAIRNNWRDGKLDPVKEADRDG